MHITISIENDDSSVTSFEFPSEFKDLPFIEQLLYLSRMHLDIQKKLTHLLFVGFFEMFGRETDLKLLAFKLMAFRVFIEKLQLEVPRNFEEVAIEHMQNPNWAKDMRACFVCDFLSYQRKPLEPM